MISYFSINSINLSENLFRACNDYSQVHSHKRVIDFFKLLFQEEGITEDLEEFGAKESKSLKQAKVTFSEYLLPLDASWFKFKYQKLLSKNYKDNPVFEFDFHLDILVPPPRL